MCDLTTNRQTQRQLLTTKAWCACLLAVAPSRQQAPGWRPAAAAPCCCWPLCRPARPVVLALGRATAPAVAVVAGPSETAVAAGAACWLLLLAGCLHTPWKGLLGVCWHPWLQAICWSGGASPGQLLCPSAQRRADSSVCVCVSGGVINHGNGETEEDSWL